ncbi:signal peptidase I [Lactococcus petauri]|uniref:Signal peptidase I n=2 Tax=Lactococcus petauri TaxID=1940789 RepID=A0A252CAF2_9LACT|nr:signal peptidase I [Lactococcus petauri]
MGSFLLMFFVVLGLSYFYSIGRVEGNSMNPTLNNRELIVTEKHPDKLKHSDIIVFEVPQLSNKEFVKRIIGLPGDTIYASQGNIYVNGEKVNNQYESQSTADFTLKEISGRATVPEDKLFVLGDNRSHSTDSRNFGFVEKTEVKGKVVMK